MKLNIQQGLLQTPYHAEEITEEYVETYIDEDGEEQERVNQVSKRIFATCADPRCRRPIGHEQECFVDTTSEEGEILCDSCGKCLRYARKKASERGETEKVTIQNLY